MVGILPIVNAATAAAAGDCSGNDKGCDSADGFPHCYSLFTA